MKVVGIVVVGRGGGVRVEERIATGFLLVSVKKWFPANRLINVVDL